mgnify:CR=1 FL=1
MRQKRPTTSSPAGGQRRRNLNRYLRKRHLHLKHRQREVQRMLNLNKSEEEPLTPPTKAPGNAP